MVHLGKTRRNPAKILIYMYIFTVNKIETQFSESTLLQCNMNLSSVECCVSKCKEIIIKIEICNTHLVRGTIFHLCRNSNKYRKST